MNKNKNKRVLLPQSMWSTGKVKLIHVRIEGIHGHRIVEYVHWLIINNLLFCLVFVSTSSYMKYLNKTLNLLIYVHYVHNSLT